MDPDSHDEPTLDDLIARVRAEGDQQRAAAAELASILTAFRAPLIAVGVGGTVADGLVCSYWNLMVAGTLNA